MLSASLWRQPVLARGEDHRRRHVARHVHRVVPGARDDFPRAVARASPRAWRTRSTQAGSNGWAGIWNSFGQLQLHAAVARDEPGLARELRVQPRPPRRPSGWRNSTEKRTSPGITLRLFGEHQQLPHRAAPVLAARAHHPVHQVDDPRRRHQRVLARRGRRGAGMRILAGGHRVVPHLRLRAGDDADLLALALQDRPLLDMQLEIRVRRERPPPARRRDSRCRPARLRTVTPSRSVSA